MQRLTQAAMLVVAAAAFAACSNDEPVSPQPAIDDDFALVMFGESGAALESSLGPQGGRPFDGRTAGPPLPDELALTDEQRAEIAALRAAFRTEHQTDLDALRAIFEEARAARAAGATRDEVHAILEGGRDIAGGLREDVQALHAAIRDVFTADQLAWIEANRRRPPGGLGPRRGPQRR
jgi:Spy/CpxP family protein refolding chaperone